VTCRVCGGSGFVAQKQTVGDGYGEVDSCPACEPVPYGPEPLDYATVVADLKAEVATCLRLLPDRLTKREPRADGQRVMLHHVQTFLRTAGVPD
jgi:hypothetical protein